jgi:hypothetical protein
VITIIDEREFPPRFARYQLTQGQLDQFPPRFLRLRDLINAIDDQDGDDDQDNDDTAQRAVDFDEVFRRYPTIENSRRALVAQCPSAPSDDVIVYEILPDPAYGLVAGDAYWIPETSLSGSSSERCYLHAPPSATLLAQAQRPVSPRHDDYIPTHDELLTLYARVFVEDYEQRRARGEVCCFEHDEAPSCCDHTDKFIALLGTEFEEDEPLCCAWHHTAHTQLSLVRVVAPVDGTPAP